MREERCCAGRYAAAVKGRGERGEGCTRCEQKWGGGWLRMGRCAEKVRARGHLEVCFGREMGEERGEETTTGVRDGGIPPDVEASATWTRTLQPESGPDHGRRMIPARMSVHGACGYGMHTMLQCMPCMTYDSASTENV